LIPETGTGIFALSNRTYAGPSGPVWDAATALFKAGHIKTETAKPSPLLRSGYDAARKIWQDGSLTNTPKPALAMNFLMDRSEASWAKRLNEIKAQSGNCDTQSEIKATGALLGNFEWSCERGTIKGALLLAPTFSPQIQSLSFDLTPAP
jgi:D-alanyl-D-alanine-carboxypeptidase/D-alanyl-D-alanine-endopeptidase